MSSDVIIRFEDVPVAPGCPRHLAENHERRWRLVRWGNMVAGHYGVEVYLVGSALRDDNPEPRDWDVRLQLDRAEFARRFGDVNLFEREGLSGLWSDGRWRWADECVKRSKEGHERTLLNVDFQLQPPGTWNRFLDAPRMRLDTRPEDAGCTGVAAGWCPIHGDCTCPEPEVERCDPACPLHAPDSMHAEPVAPLAGGPR